MPLPVRALERDDVESMTQSTGRAPFALVDREDLAPLCPHCGSEVREVYRKATGVPLGQGKKTVYFCSHCHKILGFSEGRMF
jgi:hypothetical protein